MSVDFVASSLPSPTVVSATVSEQKEIVLTWEITHGTICGSVPQFTIQTTCPGCVNHTLMEMTSLTCVNISADGTTCVIRLQTELSLCDTPPSEAVEVNVVLRGIIAIIPTYT